MPAMILRMEDLPAPLGPTMPILAPGRKAMVNVVEDDLVTVGFARLNHLVDVLSHCSSAPFVRV